MAHTKLEVDSLPAFIVASIDIKKFVDLMLSIGILSMPTEFNLKAPILISKFRPIISCKISFTLNKFHPIGQPRVKSV
jgi:hypothetical protein